MSKSLFEYESFKNFKVLEDFMQPLADAGISVYGSQQTTNSYSGSSYTDSYYYGGAASDNFFNGYFNPYNFKKKYRACFPNLEIVETIINSSGFFGNFGYAYQNNLMLNELKNLLPAFDINEKYGYNGEKLQLVVYFTKGGHIYKSNAPADLWEVSIKTGKIPDNVAEFCMFWLPMFVNGTGHANLVL